jgi:hypothetical protein
MQIVLTLALFLLAFGGLAVGVMAGRPPIKGSCGGLDCIRGIECGACTRKAGGERND